MVQRDLIDPYQFLKAGQVDLNAGTITLPLYQGQVKVSNGRGNITNKVVWYTLTDTDDKGNADALGINWSPKLTYAAQGARNATLEKNTTLTFNGGTVDFKPPHMLTAGNAPNPLL